LFAVFCSLFRQMPWQLPKSWGRCVPYSNSFFLRSPALQYHILPVAEDVVK
jgi:hypothetical protein